MATSEATNEDCMAMMVRYPDGFFDIGIVDPPYGREQHGGTDRSGHYVRQFNGKKILTVGVKHKKKKWDSVPADDSYFDELKRVSKNQIVWGVNYYPRVFGSGRIIWDKVNDGSDQSGAEIAFNSMTERVDVFRFMWRGMMQGSSILDGSTKKGNSRDNERLIHPTQKPVALYKWLLSRYAKPGWKILDTHLGSGSSRIAAWDLGFDFYATELDKDYFDAQEARFKTHVSQLRLFETVPATPEQGSLL
jgi:site-specific DNA-methyltransferase (adenine-specific)